jgi:hypothetical protein
MKVSVVLMHNHRTIPDFVLLFPPQHSLLYQLVEFVRLESLLVMHLLSCAIIEGIVRFRPPNAFPRLHNSFFELPPPLVFAHEQGREIRVTQPTRVGDGVLHF